MNARTAANKYNKLRGMTAVLAAACGLGAAAVAGTPAAWAQKPIGANDPALVAAGANAGGINAATDVSLDQLLDNQVTLSNTFRDEEGRTVPLSQYFHGNKPVLLVLPFYKCPGICTQEMNGMVDAFRDPKIKFKVGRDFEVVTVSINPKEQPDLAAMKKKEYLNQLGQSGAEKGWHFLVGDEPNIKKLADEVGFRYKYDPKTDNYAHPGGVILITPQGKVARYFYGVVYPAGQLKLGITEAGRGKVGSPVDKIILYCYHYDPQTGKYGPAIFRILQVAGFSTVAILGAFMLVSFRRDLVGGGSAVTPAARPEGTESSESKA